MNANLAFLYFTRFSQGIWKR